ncbi:nucleoside ABC transporter ATP-binding protein [Thalassoporum mexicanum PCC 7367]|uniref:ABC transporter ATP-binding protein n=1 Tax=Thalassoporum mexicanum TaxID=3457544 RepID=UPI00029FC7D6|nr:ABC transporter ATP-binding protein [Pseudanabaena sp. PCC 7367]AFY69899.1 nucleoside ABC transporter ATP-binding protein [Pseudanabaena sp. PCC 7367]
MSPSKINLAHIDPVSKGGLPQLEAIAICKQFGQFTALEQVSLHLEPGSFHALLGENGAGKSTLVKCLIGFYRPDAGQILIDRRSRQITSPQVAQKLGIGMVYQSFTSIPAMTIAENLVLARLDGQQIINWRRERQKLAAFMQQSPFPMRLDLVVGQMSAGQKQKLEILKQLYLGNRILILDEPTSVLLPDEADEVLTLLQQMVKQQQLSVLLITHKFREVLTYCDRVTVLRHGKLAGTGLVKDFGVADLAALMVGEQVALQRAVIAEQNHPELTQSVLPGTNGARPIAKHNGSANLPIVDSNRLPTSSNNGANKSTNGDRFSQPSPVKKKPKAKPVLQLDQITVRSDQGKIAVHQVDLAVYGGEIVAIAGVAGNGQKELMEVLFGQRQAVSGEILVNGEAYQAKRSQIQQHQIFALPEEPLKNACVSTMSVAENLALRGFDRPPLAKGWMIMYRSIRYFAQKLVDAFAIKTASIDQSITNLSGGNIQRTVLARELGSAKIKLLIAVNPFTGLDFTAVDHICQKLKAARDRGVAILLVSDDLDELLTLSDRLLVISEGALVYECRTKEANLQTIAQHMAGGREM